MKTSRIVAAVALVTMLGTALPAHAARNGAATDHSGTSAGIQTVGKTPKKFEGFHPSWKAWIWIGVGGVILYAFARELGGSSH